LDIGGAEQLIGRGDMLVSYQGEVTRVQCAFVDTPEVEKVAEFINKRDNVTNADAKNIYLTNGAGEGVKLVFNMLIRGGNDGIMIPIPQYPLYSALITLNGGKQIPYFLDET
jgi:aspartate/methionine/tyrosine aminotransferase